MQPSKRLGYLSGALRVSTHQHAEASGPRTHIVNFLAAMRAIGWEVYPFIAGDRLPSKWSGAGSHERLSRSVPARIAADVMRLAFGWRNAHRAWREVGTKVDWVYERFAILQALGRRAQRRGIPWILETNGLFFSEASVERKTLALTMLARRLELAAYKDCDVLVCVSETLRDAVIKEARIRPDKVVVVPNGVDPNVFDPARHNTRRLFGEIVLGFVGSVLEWQGLAPLLDVLVELRSEGIEMSLVIVGDGVFLSELRQKTQAVGLSANVRFVGRVPVEDVPAYIGGFDLGYVGHVSLARGGMYHSPLKLYEYMAMSKPVVAAAHDDARRVITDGVTGYLFEPENPADLKRALRRAYYARKDLPIMGQHARDLILAEHTWVSRVRAMIPQIERILQARRS